MGILELNSENKLNKTVMQIKNKSKFIYNNLKLDIKQMFNLVWKNPDGFTPQEILDKFGTDAAVLFTYSYQMQLILKMIDDRYEMLTPPNSYTINQDGTVTVGALL